MHACMQAFKHKYSHSHKHVNILIHTNKQYQHMDIQTYGHAYQHSKVNFSIQYLCTYAYTLIRYTCMHVPSSCCWSNTQRNYSRSAFIARRHMTRNEKRETCDLPCSQFKCNRMRHAPSSKCNYTLSKPLAVLTLAGEIFR